jgi:four helix bundle protein
VQIRSAKELKVYQMAHALAMEIFRLSQTWPPDEMYSLTNQIRRSSRGVCANLREAWSKRRYEAHFVGKLTDADGEDAETDTWLDFARDYGYLNKAEDARLLDECKEVGAMLGGMLNDPRPFLLKVH